MSVKLTILGCHSATPRSEAHPSSQFLEINNEFYLIDCGEGTQTQLRKNNIRFSKIRYVFISHLHGDHFFGLIGMISTFNLLSRKTDLHVYGPEGLKEIILTQLKLTKTWLDYQLHIHELSSKSSEKIFESEKVEVFTIPLDHRIYCNGFLFKEKPKPRKLNPVAISNYPEIEICDYQNLKDGKDFITEDKRVISNVELTLDPPPTKQYAYCSDTGYTEKILPVIKNVDLLYHETTFLEDRLDLALKTKHSTAKQAAEIAKKSGARQLLIGHYSSRYKDENDFLIEAQQVFSSVMLAETGKVIEL